MAYDFALGGVHFPTAIHDVGVTVGGGRPGQRALKINLPIYGDAAELDPREAANRLRRQIGALLENPATRDAGLYLLFAADPELNGWIVCDGGELAYSEGGPAIGDYTLELSNARRVATLRSHRPGRRVRTADRRVTTTPRDYRGRLYSADFAAQPALVLTMLPQVADVLATGHAPLVALVRKAMGADLGVLVGRPDADVVSFEQDEATLGGAGGELAIYDRRVANTPAENLSPNPDFANGSISGWTVSGSAGWTTRTFTIEAPSTHALSGPNAGRVQVTNANDATSRYTYITTPVGVTGVPIRPSERFTVTADVEVIDALDLEGPSMEVRFYDAAGVLCVPLGSAEAPATMNGNVLSSLPYPGGVPGKFRLSVTGITPTDCAFISIRIYVGVTTTPNDTGDFYIPTTKVNYGGYRSFFEAGGYSPRRRTNLMRHPSFEAVAVGAGDVASVTSSSWDGNAHAEVSDDWSKRGRRSLHVVISRTDVVTTVIRHAAATAGIPVRPGETVTFGVDLNVLRDDNTNRRLRVYFYRAGGGSSVIASSLTGPLFTGQLGEFRAVMTCVVPDDASYASPSIAGTSSGAIGAPSVFEVYVDGWTFEHGATDGSFFDGDSAGYRWTGAPHNSPSTSDPDSLGYERIFGPTQELTAGDVPTIENGLCRVRWEPAFDAFVVDAYDPNVVLRDQREGDPYVEQGRVTLWDSVAAGVYNAQTILQGADVLELTPERAVIRVVTFRTAGLQRCETYITLQRGWTGPRFELYPSASAAGVPAGAGLRWTPNTAGAVTATRSDASYSSATGWSGTDRGDFTGREPWVGLTGAALTRAHQLAVLQQAAKLVTRDDINAYGGAARKGLSIDAPFASAIAGYVTARLGFGPTSTLDLQRRAAGQAYDGIQDLAQANLSDSRQELVLCPR